MTLRISGVILMSPSCLEVITALDIHGASSLIGCSSMMPWLIISSITLNAFFWTPGLDFIIYIFFSHIDRH